MDARHYHDEAYVEDHFVEADEQFEVEQVDAFILPWYIALFKIVAMQ